LLSSFDLTTEQIVLDLEGRQVAIAHGQAWPLDKGQGLTVSIVSRKQIDNFVVLVVDVRATAGVEQSKSEKGKIPSKVSLSGYLKLTYEQIGSVWYLIGVDGLTAKATAVFDQ
jgi:hypothetical protein